jgi:hypothetical protein
MGGQSLGIVRLNAPSVGTGKFSDTYRMVALKREPWGDAKFWTYPVGFKSRNRREPCSSPGRGGRFNLAVAFSAAKKRRSSKNNSCQYLHFQE